MAISLKGKHVLITGASRGTGRAFARKLAAEGCRVSLIARNLSALEKLRDEIGENARCFGADMTQNAEIDKAVEFFEKEFGPIDILINNAGTGWYKSLDESSYEDAELTLQLNVNALVRLTKKLASGMISRQSGTILNIASDLSFRPLPNMAVYTASKHALAGFSRSLARELKDKNVKVMMLNPGLIDTGFGGREEGSIPPPHALVPDDLADVVHFMLTRPDYMLIDQMTVVPLGQDEF